MSINEKLNRYLEENGIKQSFVVQRTDISADTFSKIINGKRKMSASEFLSICDALNLDPNYFKTNSDRLM